MTWPDIFDKLDEIVKEQHKELLNGSKIRGVFTLLNQILLELDKLERQIKMTHDETIAKLNEANTTMDSVSSDIDALMAIVQQLQNADTSPDVAALIDQLDSKLQTTDAKFTPPPAP